MVEKGNLNLKMILQKNLNRFGFLLAIAGLIPIRGGVLLLQEKECGCFLIEKSLLYAHNIFFGSISLVAGLSLIALGVLAYKEKSERITKAWIFTFLFVSGVIGFSIGVTEQTQQLEKTVEGNYDELTKKLSETGWVLFYLDGCPNCHRQMDILGASVKYLRMINCDAVKCPKFVEIYPTWAKIINGSAIDVRSGFQSIEVLREMAK